AASGETVSAAPKHKPGKKTTAVGEVSGGGDGRRINGVGYSGVDDSATGGGSDSGSGGGSGGLEAGPGAEEEFAQFDDSGRGGKGRASRLVLACRAKGVSCQQPRRFGFPGGAREVCADHKVVGMVNFVEGGKVGLSAAAAPAAEAAGETTPESCIANDSGEDGLVSSRTKKQSTVVSAGGGGSGGGARGGIAARGTDRGQTSSLGKAVRKTNSLEATGLKRGDDVKPAVMMLADVAAAAVEAAASGTDATTAGVRGKKKAARSAAGKRSSSARTGASTGKVTRSAVGGGGKVSSSSSSLSSPPSPVSAAESELGRLVGDTGVGSGSNGSSGDDGGGGGGGSGRSHLHNHRAMCAEEGCPISARFGYLSTRKRVCCGTHKRFGMVNLDKNPLKRRSAAAPASSSTDEGDAT
ncbi:unnamed protein product, partial [Laminaria digitata]